jgi:hypothetical protein
LNFLKFLRGTKPLAEEIKNRTISPKEYKKLKRKNKKLAAKAKRVETLETRIVELESSLSSVRPTMPDGEAKKQTELLKEVRDIFVNRSSPKRSKILARHRKERWAETGFDPDNAKKLRTGTNDTTGNITD